MISSGDQEGRRTRRRDDRLVMAGAGSAGHAKQGGHQRPDKSDKVYSRAKAVGEQLKGAAQVLRHFRLGEVDDAGGVVSHFALGAHQPV